MIFGKLFGGANNKKALEALERAHGAREAGDIQLAIEYFGQATDCQDPAIKAESFAWRSQMYVALGLYKEALYDLNKALTISPEEWSLYGKRGEVHSLMGASELALADCERALSMDETDQFARKVLATVLKHEHRYLEALSETEALLLDDPSDPWTLTLNAEMLFATGNYEECVKAATMALTLSADDAEHAYHVRADALSRMGSFKEAVDDYTRALDVGGDNPFIYVGRAEGYIALDMLEEAAGDAHYAAALDPQCDAAFNTSARANLSGLHLSAAMIDADMALGLNPENQFARMTRARIFIMLEQFDEAISDLAMVDQISDPRMRATCYGLRAHCYNMLELYEEAVAEANRAEECDPTSGLAFANRAYAFYKAGEFDACIGECTRGIKVDRAQPELHKVRAQARVEKKDYEGAVGDSTVALQLDPKYIEAYEVRALALDYLQQYDDAARDRRAAEKFQGERRK